MDITQEKVLEYTDPLPSPTCVPRYSVLRPRPLAPFSFAFVSVELPNLPVLCRAVIEDEVAEDVLE
jgi:hypothetical protein